MTDDTMPAPQVGNPTQRDLALRDSCGTNWSPEPTMRVSRASETGNRTSCPGGSAVGERSGLETVVLTEIRGVLAEVARALPRARWELSRMRLNVLDADLRLKLGTGLQVDGLTPGEAVRGVITSCQAARTAGGRVEHRLRQAVAGVKAVGVLLGSPAPVDTREEHEQIRLRRQLSTLQADLEATQAVLARTTDALGQVANQARRVNPSVAWTGEGLPLQQFTGRMAAAQKQTRDVDQALDRAQVRTDRIGIRVGTLAGPAARHRMRAHRDHSPSPSTPSPGVPR